jgi:hypothetical protein
MLRKAVCCDDNDDVCDGVVPSCHLQCVTHHGMNRPRWTGAWGVGSIKKHLYTDSKLPVALQRLLQADIVLTSYSSLVAAEWAPVAPRASRGLGTADKENQTVHRPVAGTSSCHVEEDCVEDYSSDSESDLEGGNERDRLGTAAARGGGWISRANDEGPSDVKPGNRLSCLHQVTWSHVGTSTL